MLITLEEMKNYLRVDFDDDDALIEALITAATRICMDILRTEDTDELSACENAKAAILYTVAYLYEHREEADHHTLTITLRSLLFGARKEVF